MLQRHTGALKWGSGLSRPGFSTLADSGRPCLLGELASRGWAAEGPHHVADRGEVQPAPPAGARTRS
eukprot:9597701-Alexandrium_andersonii.AAC.1